MEKKFSREALLRIMEAQNITLLIHLPKSGGTTIKEWYRRNSSFYSLDADSLKTYYPEICVGCGTFCDRVESSRSRLQLLTDSLEPIPRIFIDFGHVSMSEVCSFVEQLREIALADSSFRSNLPRIQLLLPYRSETARFVSYFRHYWDRALVPVSSSGIEGLHKLKNKAQIRNDSEHYRTPDGKINSKLWLEAFIKFGVGQASFRNTQFFRLGDLVRLYRLRLFPVAFRTEHIDQVFFKALGTAPVRKNVSEKFPEVERALIDMKYSVCWFNLKEIFKNPGTAITFFILTFRSKLPLRYFNYLIHFDKNEV